MTTDDTLTPGRDLDERVARVVWPDDWLHDPPRNRSIAKRFSEDTAAAMALLDTLAGRGWGISYFRHNATPDFHQVEIWHDGHNGGEGVHGTGSSLPLAICACVLAALGDDQ